MVRRRPLGLQSLVQWLLRPQRRWRDTVRQRLTDALAAALPSRTTDPALALAILEGALALGEADGSFGDQEWELYRCCLSQLHLPADQLDALGSQDSPNLTRICQTLVGGLTEPERLAVARCYLLFAAADGHGARAEQEMLREVLQALGHAGLEAHLPELCRDFQPRHSWLVWMRIRLGNWLQRLLQPARPQRRDG